MLARQTGAPFDDSAMGFSRTFSLIDIARALQPENWQISSRKTSPSTSPDSSAAGW
jgi:hypothetical protein